MLSCRRAGGLLAESAAARLRPTWHTCSAERKLSRQRSYGCTTACRSMISCWTPGTLGLTFSLNHVSNCRAAAVRLAGLVNCVSHPSMGQCLEAAGKPGLLAASALTGGAAEGLEVAGEQAAEAAAGEGGTLAGRSVDEVLSGLRPGRTPPNLESEQSDRAL